jgi:hypothetical protein
LRELAQFASNAIGFGAMWTWLQQRLAESSKAEADAKLLLELHGNQAYVTARELALKASPRMQRYRFRVMRAVGRELGIGAHLDTATRMLERD